MSNCDSCKGCGGCASQLELTEGELVLLRQLGEIPFLPVARKREDMTPIYLEGSEYSQEQYSLILQCLEIKGLIRLDYDRPLKNCDMSQYQRYPVHGSMALTQRGYTVLQLLECQGILEE